MMKKTEKQRCAWCLGSELEMRYHDKEWGRPLHNDQKLFEFLTLEGAQAGLSWVTILKKREHYRDAFDDFEIARVAKYSKRKIESLLKNPGIVRNRLKVESTVSNANIALEVQQEYGSLDKYLWQFVDGKPIINRWTTRQHVPATSAQSDLMSKTLKKRGFRFVGSTICYAFMQATGMVNDHSADCFRHPAKK
jgi:DNA-3-methyladenine glycosylase I